MDTRRLLNATSVFLLLVSLGAGFFIELALGQMPCITCFLQRLCMIGTSLGLYLNIVEKERPKYYGFSSLSALLGLLISLRHASVNFCTPIAEGEFLFWGQRVYMWSFLVFFCSLTGISLFLCFYKPCLEESKRRRDGIFYVVTAFLALGIGIGFYSAFKQLGWQFRGL